MHIISYVEGITVDGAHLHLRNPRWYDKPERGFDYVIAKEEHILNDYRQMGVQPYAEVQEEAEKEVELSWNEMRKLAKELSGEVIRSKEQAQEILTRHGY
jgi:hypothetical protein